MYLEPVVRASTSADGDDRVSIRSRPMICTRYNITTAEEHTGIEVQEVLEIVDAGFEAGVDCLSVDMLYRSTGVEV